MKKAEITIDLNAVRRAAEDFLVQFDRLDGVAQMPLEMARRVCLAADCLRLALGQESKIKTA